MISRLEFARQIDGPALEKEIDRLSGLGGSWVGAAQILSRRINCTLDWASLGPAGERFKFVASRGEAVVFWDRHKRCIIKLRGREENGFGTAGFGCILGQDTRGKIILSPGTMEQAIEREFLSWKSFQFACVYEARLEDGAGLLLRQDFVDGQAPTEKEIHHYMKEQGWTWMNGHSSISPVLQPYAWKRGNIGAFDANETNFIKAHADGEIYPIDLIVWHWPG